MEHLMRSLATFVAALTLGLISAGLAGAADGHGAAISGGAIAPTRPADDLAGGWLASSLMDANVCSNHDKPTGEVQDLILDRYGTIQELIVGTESRFRIGVSLFRVPWSEVRVGKSLGEITVQMGKGTEFKDLPLDSGHSGLRRSSGLSSCSRKIPATGLSRISCSLARGTSAVVAQPGPGTRARDPCEWSDVRPRWAGLAASTITGGGGCAPTLRKRQLEHSPL